MVAGSPSYSRSVVLARALFVLWTAVTLIPGVGELIEDGVHVVLDGHDDHADGEAPCPEHGCAPTSHHCSCCVSLSILAPMAITEVTVSIASGELSEWAPTGAARPGFARRLPRPPSA